MNIKKLPEHVAIIMDGNGRWAKERNLPRIAGHYEGVKRAEEIVDFCADLGIRYLSLFTFSTENWKRPAEEVAALFDLFERYLKEKRQELKEKSVRVIFIGRRDRIPMSLVEEMHRTEKETACGHRITLILAVDYGGRDDIVRAVNHLLHQRVQEVDESTFRQALDLRDLPDPDLLIRTGGEKRISNFMLWNLAYTELYFTEVYWPDFGREEFVKALEDYANRERRFGAVV